MIYESSLIYQTPMKTIFPILILAFFFLSSNLHAQTLTGPVKIDSTLHVVDSVYIEKNMTIEQDVKVKGVGIFTEELKAKSNLKVLGEAKMKGDAFVEGTFKFKGLADPLALDDRLLIINSNGKTDAIAKSGLTSSFYSADCFTFQQQGGSGNIVNSPSWQSAAGINAGNLFTGVSCPANVGIGIAVPEARLDVRGTGHIQSNTGIGALPFIDVQLNVATTEQVGLCVQHSWANDYGYALKALVDNPTTKAFAVVNTANLNQDVFRVNGDGRLWATELNVYHEGDFPDYVFASDYELRPLAALENYINAEGHLPNIPTAEEVAENGINVSSLQVAQLEKIEELTLYVIELNKQLEALKAEMQELKKW